MVDPPANGTLGWLNPVWGDTSYTPNLHFSGKDSFTFHVGDGTQYSNTATATITVKSRPDHKPTCNDYYSDIANGQSTPVVLYCRDQYDEPLTLSIESGPTNGKLDTNNPTGGSVTYTPNPGYVGADSFTFRSRNESDYSEPAATVTLTVLPPPDHAPACTEASQIVYESMPTTFALKCTDSDGDPLALSIVSSPTAGDLSGIDEVTGNVTYTPAAGFLGTDSFTFKATDGRLESNQAKVRVTVVTPPPAKPGTQGGATIASLPLSGLGVRARSAIRRIDSPARLRGGGVVAIRLTCGGIDGDRCQGSLGLRAVTTIPRHGKRAGRRSLGKADFSMPVGQSGPVEVHISKAGQRLVKQLKRVRVRASASSSDTSGLTAPKARTITLKAR